MFHPFLRAALLAGALIPWAVVAAPLSLDTALQLATQRSESARAARAGMQGAKEASKAAGQMPDPVLRAGVDNLPATGADRFSTTRDSMTMKRIGLSQEWLSPEKRFARQAAADAEVAKEAVQAQAALDETRLQTALAYLDAFYAEQGVTLATLLVHHAHEELEVSRGRLSSAAGSSQEVLALAGAKGMSDDELAEALQQRDVARLLLQRWIGVVPGELTPEPGASPPPEAVYIDSHPVVAALQRDLDLARQTASVASSNRRPNWTWELAYGQRTGYSDMVSVGVSIPLPVAPAERQDRETASKLALVDKAEAGLEEARRMAAAEYQTLASDAQQLQQRIARYRTNVGAPAAQRTAVATASYQSNQGSLMALFETRHAEVAAQRRLLTLERDLARTQARLTYRPLSTPADGAAR